MRLFQKEHSWLCCTHGRHKPCCRRTDSQWRDTDDHRHTV